jgi:hypothetical protein
MNKSQPPFYHPPWNAMLRKQVLKLEKKQEKTEKREELFFFVHV